ncbi:MAG: aldehyde dehydrogenase family protein, partial [Burkholderiales bacterium]
MGAEQSGGQAAAQARTERAYTALALWIGGRAILAEDRQTQPVHNPATGEVLGQLPHARDADLDAALEAAAAGFEIWRRTPPIERARLLRRTADRLRKHRDALARLIVLELGKPITDALRETDSACDMFEWAAEEARRGYGRLIPARGAGYRLMVVPEPFGPVAAFSGWNAPSITPARKLSGALAAGCSIVIKPSEATPATALMIAQALAEVGL